jgi:CO dehydrogenase maturation factor
MKIAVSGKGGTGKTIITATLAHFLAKKGFTVLAIDADPSPNLALTLGIIPEEAEKIVPISENRELIESKTSTGIPGMYKLSFTVDDIVQDFSIGSPFGVNLLVMGTVRSADTGCTCPANTLLRMLLRHLIVERDEIVILDMEAGIEHLGRGTAKHVDVILVTAEPSLKSLEIAKKIRDLATEMGVENIFLVGNKVSGDEESRLIQDFATRNNFPLIGLIPYDQVISKAEIMGESPLNYLEESKALTAIRKIGEKLLTMPCKRNLSN